MGLEGRVLIQTAVATLNRKLRAPEGEHMKEGVSLKFPYFPKKPTASHLITKETKLKFLTSSPVEPGPRLVSIYLPQKDTPYLSSKSVYVSISPPLWGGHWSLDHLVWLWCLDFVRLPHTCIADECLSFLLIPCLLSVDSSRLSLWTFPTSQLISAFHVSKPTAILPSLPT